jgi:hypothetical protein
MNVKIVVVSTLIFFCSIQGLVAVVHLDGKHASIQVVGSQASWQKQAYNNEGVWQPVVEAATQNIVNPEHEAAAQARVQQLETLVQRLSAVLEQSQAIREQEQQEQTLRAARARQSILDGDVRVVGQELRVTGVSEQPLSLRFKGDARVICSDEIFTIRTQDKIVVAGKNNELIVPRGMHLLGELVFEQEDAQLAISVAGGAVCVLNPMSGCLNLTSGAVLEFKGPGALNVAGNCQFSFGDLPSAARLVMTNKLQASINGVGGVGLCGIGSFVLDQGATFDLASGQRLSVGLQDQDYINFIIRRGSALNLQAGLDVELVFEKGSYDLAVQEGGSVYIASGARMALHDLTLVRGVRGASCKRLTINTGGRIDCSRGGSLAVGRQEAVCVFDVDKLAIAGEGCIEPAVLAKSIRIQSQAAIKQATSFDEVVRILINKQASFKWATVFEDDAEKTWVFLPVGDTAEQLVKGRVVELSPEITLASEDVAAKRVLGVMRGIFVEIGDGVKQLNMPRTRSFRVDGEQFYAGLRDFFPELRASL